MNDHPALARASVGVAVAKSLADAPATKEGKLTCDVLLLTDNGVEAVPLLLEVAHQTKAIVHQV